jgi:hypothetical protein
LNLDDYGSNLLDLRGEPRRVVVEGFCNQYVSMIMLTTGLT